MRRTKAQREEEAATDKRFRWAAKVLGLKPGGPYPVQTTIMMAEAQVAAAAKKVKSKR